MRAVFLILLAIAAAQQGSTDPLQPIAFLVGRWEGPQEGQPGKGTARREYRRVLDGRFIQEENESTYPPQERNPKGEVHHHMGMFSFDRARGQIVFRQFHVEGFVNQYVFEPGASDATRLVFVTEAIENIPTGWRARETYVLHGRDELEEIFELAAPDAGFELYSRARLKRMQ